MDGDTPLERQLWSIFGANREGAYATQRARKSILEGAARVLREHFGLQKWANLKEKHVAHVIETWKSEDAGRRSLPNKLSHLRWLVGKIGKANLVPRENSALGVESGPRYTRAGKVITDAKVAEIIASVPDERRRMAILFGRQLGMRFREAMLFRPWRDWDGADRIFIKRGTKGSHPRYLFIHNARQIEVLNQARALVQGEASLVPKEFPTFEKWRQQSYRTFRDAGISRKDDTLFHDLRRTYANERFKQLANEHKLPRDRVIAIVSREMGHKRAEILKWYIADFGDEATAA